MFDISQLWISCLNFLLQPANYPWHFETLILFSNLQLSLTFWNSDIILVLWWIMNIQQANVLGLIHILEPSTFLQLQLYLSAWWLVGAVLGGMQYPSHQKFLPVDENTGGGTRPGAVGLRLGRRKEAFLVVGMLIQRVEHFFLFKARIIFFTSLDSWTWWPGERTSIAMLKA